MKYSSNIKDKKQFLISLRLNTSISFMLIVFFSCMILGMVIFFSIRHYIRNDVRLRLRDDVVLSVKLIDAEKHHQVLTKDDQIKPEYLQLKKVLQDIRKSCTKLKYVYTMRKVNNKVQFVIDSEVDRSKISNVGDVYDKPTREMLAAFEKPYGVQVENDFFKDEWGVTLSSYIPFFTADGKVEGILGLDMCADDIIAYENEILIIIVLISLVTALVFGIGGVIYSMFITRPLLKLSDEMEKVQHLELDNMFENRTSIKEIVRMNDSLYNMKNGLKSLRKYIPADLVVELLRLKKEAVIDGEKRMMTVSFSDIVNFTSISERFSPEKLVEYLGVYFAGSTDIIMKHKGNVDKYIGDAIMSFWGAPQMLDGHAVYACLSALQCQELVKKLSSQWKHEGISDFGVRIGINTGEVIVGNVGYEKRMNYTVIGDNVNLASRLESLNKYYGTNILISQYTYHSACDKIEARMIDVVAVKGKKNGVLVYELLGEKGCLSEAYIKVLDIYNNGVSEYMGRNWQRALSCFDSVLKLWPDDKPARILHKRCGEFIENPPPDSWDGVIVMSEK